MEEPEIPGNTTLITQEKTPIQLTESTRAAVGTLNKFGWSFTMDMTNTVDANPEIESKNVIVSPLSASMVFSMIANGLDEIGQKAYTDYLGTSDIKSLNELSKTLLEQLPKADELADMKLANSYWVNSNKNLSLSSDYASLISDYYKAEISTAPFATKNKEVLNSINRWGSDNTNGMIPKFMDWLNPEFMSIALNALYFKAPWTDEIFPAKNTQKNVFHGSEKDEKVDMMESLEQYILYSEDDYFQMFTLNFGNGAFSFKVILPNKNLSLESAARLLNFEELETLNKMASSCYAKVKLPKFKLDNKYDLNDMLKANGHSELLSGTCKAFGKDVEIGVLYSQATSFKVDEKGAEAAAITEGDIFVTAIPIEPEAIEIKVDRPFYFSINEYSTGACLISGRITQL